MEPRRQTGYQHGTASGTGSAADASFTGITDVARGRLQTISRLRFTASAAATLQLRVLTNTVGPVLANLGVPYYIQAGAGPIDFGDLNIYVSEVQSSPGQRESDAGTAYQLRYSVTAAGGVNWSVEVETFEEP